MTEMHTEKLGAGYLLLTELLQSSAIGIETSNPGVASLWLPVITQLLSSTLPVKVKQYPVSKETKAGIRKYINYFRDAGVLVPCSYWNSPLPPVV